MKGISLCCFVLHCNVFEDIKLYFELSCEDNTALSVMDEW